MRKALFVVLMSILLVAATAVAQEVTGSIVGTVTDPSGAIVPKATVTVTNTDTKVVVRTLTTDDSGAYNAPLLPIGRYSVTAEAPGFKKVSVANVEVTVNSRLTINPMMQVGSGAETITVEANAVQVELQTAEASTLISGTEIRELSLNSRNYEQLVGLMPGVTYGGGDQLYIGTTNPFGQANVVSFSINGQRNSQNNWTVDGADNVDRGSNLTLQSYPSVDAIAEFKVQRGLYSAEGGRAGGGQINVVTRSGTDAFHGSAYEFFRNDVLNANTYFNKARTVPLDRPKLRYNNFGYTIGGPIKRSKTFFFFSQEFRRVLNYTNFSAVVPTTAMEAGQFTALPNNPATGLAVPQYCIAFSAPGGTCTTRGNTVAVIHPIAQAYINDIFKKVPDPNRPSVLTLDSLQAGTFNQRQEIVKLDHNFTDKIKGSFRFVNDSIPTLEPNALFSSGAGIPGVANTKTDSPGRSYASRMNWNLSSTWILEGGYNYSSGAIISEVTGLMNPANSPTVATAVAAVLPFTPTLKRLPTVTFTSGGTLGSFGHYDNTSHNHNVFGNATKIWGNHSIKFGAQFHRYNKNENQIASGNTGSFAFNNNGAPGTGTATFPTGYLAATGQSQTVINYTQAFINFLLGNVTTFSQVNIDPVANIFANQFEAYVQDDFRVRRNLTLNLGLRYSLFAQPTDANGRLSNFDPSKYVPANALAINGGTGATSGSLASVQPANADPINGIIRNGANSPWGAQVGETAKFNFAPRFGVAWDPWGDGKNVFRAGYGVFFDAYLFGVFQQNVGTNPPFVNTQTFSNTTFSAPTGGVGATPLPRALRATPLTPNQPYIQQWTVDFQKEWFKNAVMTLGYVGSKGTHLIGVIDINQPQAGQYVTAGLGNAPVGGVVPFLTSTNIQRIHNIRPYKGFGAINAILPIFNSNYHSLQSSFSWKFTGNSLIKANYTWSKALTDNQTDRSTAPQYSYDINGEYGPSQLDRTHVFTVHYNYELPFHRDQKGFVGHVLGGWQLSGIISYAAGLPLTVTDGSTNDPAGIGNRDSGSASGARPDIIGDPNGGPQTFTQWFNTAAFAHVPAGQYRPGTAHRGVVRGPGYGKWDVSVFKNFKIREGMNFQFRTETFNVFNHTNFLGVNTSFVAGSTTFGNITSTRDPRIIQFGGKFTF